MILIFDVLVKSLLPMVSPDNLVITGWDINKLPLDKAMERAEVFDWNLQEKLQILLLLIKFVANFLTRHCDEKIFFL